MFLEFYKVLIVQRRNTGKIGFFTGLFLFLIAGCAAPPRSAFEDEPVRPRERYIQEAEQDGAEFASPYTAPVQVDNLNNTVEVSTVQQRYVNVYSSGGDDWTPNRRLKINRSYTLNYAGEKLPAIREARSKVQDESGEAVAVALREARGFRVQLANVTSQEKADEIALKARELFRDVYVEYLSPNYKVRIGNFRQRSQADAAADSARSAGFREAWVVPSKILVPR